MLKGLVANLVRYSIWSAVLPDALQSGMTIRQELFSSSLEIPYDACDLFTQVLIEQIHLVKYSILYDFEYSSEKLDCGNAGNMPYWLHATRSRVL